MHPALLDAYMDALPALEAQEQLRAVTAAALGSGRMEPRLADRLLTDLRRTAGIRRPRAARPRDLADLRRTAGAAGVGVRVQETAEDGLRASGGTPGPPRPPDSLLGPENEAEGV